MTGLFGGDEEWTPVRIGKGRQRHGRIAVPARNSQRGVETGHVNRAGRRLYVAALQTRQVRRNVVGFGRWRRHQEGQDESWAAQTAQAVLEPRWYRRYLQAAVYRAARKARPTRITPTRLRRS